MLTKLDALVYPSQIYSKLMRQYSAFFASLFGNEFIGFGYERLNKNGFYEAISNNSRIAEIFIETKAAQLMQFITKQLRITEHGFIYPCDSADQSIYNQFRIQLEKQLDMHSTFYVMEPCLNFQHIFVWNFRPPLKLSSLIKWENKILLHFMNNRKSIQYILENFKKVYQKTISKKVTPVKLLNASIEHKEVSSARTLGEQLVEKNWLSKKDLYLKNIELSKKEALCTHFYLQGMSAKEIASEMFLSKEP